MASTSVCYFIRCNDLIKIGVSTRWSERLKTYQRRHEAVEVIGIIPGGRNRERSLHKLFAAHCLGGEWFRDCPEIRATIKDIVDNAPPPPAPVPLKYVAPLPPPVPRAPSEHELRLERMDDFAPLYEGFMSQWGGWKNELGTLTASLQLQCHEAAEALGFQRMMHAVQSTKRDLPEHIDALSEFSERCRRTEMLVSNIIVCGREQAARDAKVAA